MIMPNVVPRPHASPSYLGDFDLKRRHKNECYLVSASRTYLERSFGPHNSAGVHVGYSLDSPLRSQDPRGGSDFLAPSRPRGRFLAFGGPLLRSVAAKKVHIIECVILAGSSLCRCQPTV